MSSETCGRATLALLVLIAVLCAADWVKENSEAVADPIGSALASSHP